MGHSPIPIIAVIMSIMAFQFLFTGAALIDITPPTEFAQPSNQTASIPIVGDILSAGGILLGIFNVIWEIIVVIARLLTFDIEGIPTFLRFMFATPMILGLVWSVAELVRGN